MNPSFIKQLKFDLRLDRDIPRMEEGGYRLELAPQLEVEISPLEEGVSFEASVGKCEGEAGSEGFLTSLLHANLLGQGTGGALLSLSPTGEAIVLREEMPQEAPYVEFRDRLERFCNFAEYWQIMVMDQWSQG